MNYEEFYLDHPFLERFKEYPCPPKQLFVRGKLPDKVAHPHAVAIVGSRRCTKYGEAVAYDVAYRLAQLGVIIISGLAYGIDACAHRGCLDAGGITIAVLGTPIDRIYPARNEGLAKEILKAGAIISEYAPGSETHPYHFTERNRIVSGLADIVLIVEASDHSGTLITARHANDQNKEVFAVPGDITRPMSAGCLRLIRDGALIYTDFSDLLTALNIGDTEWREASYKTRSEAEQAVIAAIKAGCNTVDDIIAHTDFLPSDVARILTVLELEDIVRNSGVDYWTLV